jgi:hypothetical protein
MTDEKTCYNCGNKNCNVYYSIVKKDCKRHFETYEYKNFDCVNHNKWKELKVEETRTDKMTDEEKLAEKYVNGIPMFAEEGEGFSRTQMQRAFLAGLKAGRPKWYKVADGDYPPCEKGNYTINVLTDCGDIAYYDYNLDCWIAEPSSAEIDPPIAWCEILKYTEE